MKLFSKLKDYNAILEEILDKKYFSSSVKNLFLSMIYKVEISYKDYKQVKRAVREKEEFLEELLETIKKYCDNIKTVGVGSEEEKLLIKNHVKALTNEKERSMLTYPTEVALLYGISNVMPKYFYMRNSFIFKKEFQKNLVDGYVLNNLEILNNFNGWSWDDNQRENIDYISNLVYQNLLLILGDRFLSVWRNYGSTKREFLDEMRTYISSITGNNFYFVSLCKILYLNSGKKEKEILEQKLKENLKEFNKMSNKEKYIEEIKIRKINLTKSVQKIDIILNNQKLLAKEFDKRNAKLDEGKKIGNIKVLVAMLGRERQGYINEIAELSSMLKPNIFLKKKQELQELSEILLNKNSIEKEIIIFQKEFLKILDKKLKKINTTEEIVDIIYKLRYYRNIKIEKDKYLKDIAEIEKLSDDIMKKIVTMACKQGVIRIISMDIPLNYEIIKYAIDTRIIKLEEIKLSLETEKNSVLIKVYDKEVFEKQGKKELEDAKKQIEIKSKRMIMLFS